MNISNLKFMLILVLVPFSLQKMHAGTDISSDEDSIRMDAVWMPDNGDGTYTNPILFADYSDPDIVKVGSDFYMVSSSFNCAPGVPVLHSKDLINWEIIGHVFDKQPPYEVYDKPGHGVGVWAPSIRYHNSKFYVYYADPDFGIYQATATDPAGPWDHKLVQEAYGWIDPCPFWDDNDSTYLVHAYAKSRTGFNSILTLRRMSQDGENISLTDTIPLFDGNDPSHPRQTVEGPKMYKRNGFYYVFAPYNGVANGSQAVFRADNINGPYQDSTVLERGSTNINGPHQGGFVELESGESWFVHFQELLPYGRIVHLQPMTWENDWPSFGEDFDGNGIGEPVRTYTKPDVGTTYAPMGPQTSDKFNDTDLGLQWQWHSNFDSSWFSLTDNPGYLRLNAVTMPENFVSLWDVGSMLLQKLPAERFSFTARIDFNLEVGETAGLVMMGQQYGFVGVTATDTGLVVSLNKCTDARGGSSESMAAGTDMKIEPESAVYLRVNVVESGRSLFSYSLNGIDFTTVGGTILPDEGRWIGAKVGLFCRRPFDLQGDAGYVDIDWVAIDNVYNKIPGVVSEPNPGDGDTIIFDNYIRIRWTGDEVFTDSLYVYLDTQPNPSTLIGTTTSKTYKVEDLEIGKTYYWRIDAKNELGITPGPVWSFTTIDETSTVSTSQWNGFGISKINPNPFNDFTNIEFNIPKAGKVNLSIYSSDGKLITVLVDREFLAGKHHVQFNKTNQLPGVYFVRLDCDGKVLMQKIIIQ